MIPSSELEPAADVPRSRSCRQGQRRGARAVAVIKLNGGLATTMGLHRPKSLIEAREGHSFLDIIIGQTLALRARRGIGLPLLLMDSEATRRHVRGARRASGSRTAGYRPTSCRA